MSFEEKMSVKQIKELADDIRVIKDFSENNGFDGSLLKVNVSPGSIRKFDWPLLGLFMSVAVIIILVLIKIFGEFTGNDFVGLLIVSLVPATAAAMCTHLKFNNIGVTLIIVIGIVAVIAIGFGVLTPKEAIEKAEQFAK